MHNKLSFKTPATKTHLARANLTYIEYRTIQQTFHDQAQNKARSRRSIHKGGPVKVSKARIKKRKRDKFKKSKAIRKAKKRITTSISAARKT
jgi:hypothetical protein